MQKLLEHLNKTSPFTWEIEKEGSLYTILCEQMEVHDPDSGMYLNNLSRIACENWLKKIIMMERSHTLC